MTLDQVQRRGGVDMDRYDVVSDDAKTTGPLAGRSQGSQQFRSPTEVAGSINLLNKKDVGYFNKIGQKGIAQGGGQRNAYAEALGGNRVNVRRGGGHNFLIAQQVAREQTLNQMAMGYRQALTSQDYDRANKTAEQLYRSGYDPDSIRAIQAEVSEQGEMQGADIQPGTDEYRQTLFQGVQEAIAAGDYTALEQIASEMQGQGMDKAARGIQSTAKSIRLKQFRGERMQADRDEEERKAQAEAGPSPETFDQLEELLNAGDTIGATKLLTPSMGKDAGGFVNDMLQNMGRGEDLGEPGREAQASAEDQERRAEVARLDSEGKYDEARALAMSHESTAGLVSQVRSGQRMEEIDLPKAGRAREDKRLKQITDSLDPEKVFSGRYGGGQPVDTAMDFVTGLVNDLKVEYPSEERGDALDRVVTRLTEMSIDLDPGADGGVLLQRAIQLLEGAWSMSTPVSEMRRMRQGAGQTPAGQGARPSGSMWQR